MKANSKGKAKERLSPLMTAIVDFLSKDERNCISAHYGGYFIDDEAINDCLYYVSVNTINKDWSSSSCSYCGKKPNRTTFRSLLFRGLIFPKRKRVIGGSTAYKKNGEKIHIPSYDIDYTLTQKGREHASQTL